MHYDYHLYTDIEGNSGVQLLLSGLITSSLICLEFLLPTSILWGGQWVCPSNQHSVCTAPWCWLLTEPDSLDSTVACLNSQFSKSCVARLDILFSLLIWHTSLSLIFMCGLLFNLNTN